jgi:hypothetical protein
MAERPPLVLDRDTARVRELRNADDLDIPLNERVDRLETELRELKQALMMQGIEIPEPLEES